MIYDLELKMFTASGGARWGTPLGGYLPRFLALLADGLDMVILPFGAHVEKARFRVESLDDRLTAHAALIQMLRHCPRGDHIRS